MQVCSKQIRLTLLAEISKLQRKQTLGPVQTLLRVLLAAEGP